MNKRIEEEFVNNYIVSNKRERLIFELQGKKRRNGVDRFCHCVDNLVIKSAIKERGKYILQELQKTITAAKTDKCYVISFFEDIDGKVMDKNEVLDTIIGRGMPSIVIFDDFVIIETEQEQGPAMKYLLYR